MKNRAQIIVGSIALIILLGATLYFIFKPSAHLTVSNGVGFGDTGSGTVTPGSTVEPGTGASRAGVVVAPNLIKITNGPVSAGEAVFDIAPALIPSAQATSSATSSTAFIPANYTPGDVGVHYIDRESGNIYEYLALSRKLSRISSKTLPGIQEASWLPDGSMAIVRFLSQANSASHVTTYALPSTGTGGYFFQQDLDQATVIGSSTVFVLASNPTGSTGSTAKADGTGSKTLFSSALSSIILKASGANVVAVTKAAFELDGYAFSLSGGAFSPILGPLKGLTILPSPSGKILLYSYTDGTALHMAAFNMNDGTVTNLPLATVADKCVWASNSISLYCGIPSTLNDANIPDDWYQGVTSFSDKIWRIDLSSRLATLVVDPSTEGKIDIDVVNLTIDPSSQVLVFRNKKDSSLWAYTL